MNKRGFLAECVGVGCWVFGVDAIAQQGLLKVEDAFAFSVVRRDVQWIEIEYLVADGYQLYADKFGFKLDKPGVAVKEVVFPKALERFDSVLEEKIKYYSGRVKISIRLTDRSESLKLTVIAQGCSVQLGICYPQMGKSFVVPAI